MGGACVTRSATRICIGPSPCAPLADDIGLVADGTPYADAADVLTGFGAVEIVIPTVEHGLAAARPRNRMTCNCPEKLISTLYMAKVLR